MRRYAARLSVALLTFFAGCAATVAVRDNMHKQPPQQKKVITYVTVEHRYEVY